MLFPTASDSTARIILLAVFNGRVGPAHVWVSSLVFHPPLMMASICPHKTMRQEFSLMSESQRRQPVGSESFEGRLEELQICRKS